MELIVHRINTIAELKNVPNKFGLQQRLVPQLQTNYKAPVPISNN